LQLTASAAFLVQQALASDIPAAVGPQGLPAPSFDAALGDAFGDAVKAVAESLKKK
jgi:hypothetical protein